MSGKKSKSRRKTEPEKAKPSKTERAKVRKSARRRGYMAERKVRMKFEECGWKTIRAGASLGEADVVAIKDGRAILMQVKSTKKKNLYYYEYMEPKLGGLPFYVVVDFGYGNIRVYPPEKKMTPETGEALNEFLKI